MPKPFAHVGPADRNPLVDLPGGLGIRVSAPNGLPSALADAIAVDLARRLAADGIPAHTSISVSSAMVLSGEARSIDGADDHIAGRTAADLIGVIDWRITGPDGRQVAAFEQRLRGDPEGWAAGDPELAAVVAADAGASVAATLVNRPLAADGRDDPARSIGSTTAIIDAQPRIAVLPVAGAPGNGAHALAESMRRALLRDGRALTGEPAKAAYVVAGEVSMGEPKNGRRLLTIEWQVQDGDGRSLGRVRQSNPVRTGAVEGQWGSFADTVATAASPGILDVLTQVEAAADRDRREADGGSSAP